MSAERPMNLRGLFESNTRVTTLQELEKQGKSRVKVVNTTQIIKLITEAVESVVERRAMMIAEQERETIIKDSNDEFRRLLKEKQGGGEGSAPGGGEVDQLRQLALFGPLKLFAVFPQFRCDPRQSNRFVDILLRRSSHT